MVPTERKLSMYCIGYRNRLLLPVYRILFSCAVSVSHPTRYLFLFVFENTNKKESNLWLFGTYIASTWRGHGVPAHIMCMRYVLKNRDVRYRFPESKVTDNNTAVHECCQKSLQALLWRWGMDHYPPLHQLRGFQHIWRHFSPGDLNLLSITVPRIKTGTNSWCVRECIADYIFGNYRSRVDGTSLQKTCLHTCMM